MPVSEQYCIFCGGPFFGGAGRTGEHIFADWLKAHIPRTKREHRVSSTVIRPDRSDHSIQEHSGDPHSQKLRIVCGRCNNGWMSRLQERAKPHLIPLLKADAHAITPYAARTLAGWLAMSMAAGQFRNRQMASISREELDHIRLCAEPPKGWKVWIGVSARQRFPSLSYNAFPIAKNRVEAIGREGLDALNSHSTTMCFGEHLYGHALGSSTATDFMRQWEYPPILRLSMRQVWPPVEAAIKWPPHKALTDQGLYILNNFFVRLAQMVHAREIND